MIVTALNVGIACTALALTLGTVYLYRQAQQRTKSLDSIIRIKITGGGRSRLVASGPLNDETIQKVLKSLSDEGSLSISGTSSSSLIDEFWDWQLPIETDGPFETPIISPIPGTEAPIEPEGSSIDAVPARPIILAPADRLNPPSNLFLKNLDKLVGVLGDGYSVGSNICKLVAPAAKVVLSQGIDSLGFVVEREPVLGNALVREFELYQHAFENRKDRKKVHDAIEYGGRLRIAARSTKIDTSFFRQLDDGAVCYILAFAVGIAAYSSFKVKRT